MYKKADFKFGKSQQLLKPSSMYLQAGHQLSRAAIAFLTFKLGTV